MADSNDLGRLLAQLRGVASPLERMKLIARAWRSVKRLGPRERRVLARQVGIDGAEELIEGIAVSRGGLSPATVQRAMDQLRGLRPGRLKQTLKDLQDPEQRRVLIDRGITAATDLIAGPEEAEPPESAPAIEIEEEEEPAVLPEPAPPVPRRPIPEPPVPEPARREATAAAAAAAVAAGAAKRSAQPKTAGPAPRSRTVESARAPAPSVESRPAVPAAEPSRAPKTVAQAPPAPPPAAAVAAPAGSVEDSEFLRLVVEQDTLFRRLLVLRENLTPGLELSAEQLRALLDLFTPGWARRRVVSALIEARVPDSLEEAVFLIEQLDSRASRRWCAGTLLREWDLSAEQQVLLAARHG